MAGVAHQGLSGLGLETEQGEAGEIAPGSGRPQNAVGALQDLRGRPPPADEAGERRLGHRLSDGAGIAVAGDVPGRDPDVAVLVAQHVVEVAPRLVGDHRAGGELVARDAGESPRQQAALHLRQQLHLGAEAPLLLQAPHEDRRR